MVKNYLDITLALAGVCQSAQLVQQLAYQSQCDEESLRISFHSLLDLNPPAVHAVYGDNPAHLRMGLETVQSVLNALSREGLGAELTRYTLGMIVLERKLNGNRGAQTELSRCIDELDHQLSHFDLLSNTFISAMARIYTDIISPLGPRIQVTGAPAALQNTQIQDKVRAVLLAGIRSAVLWRQVGGSRLQLIFARNRLCKEAKEILSYAY
ncbi:MAG: high frequency lysogenization protein HflD [Sodalis sp. (in: enterobacteria)]